MEGKTPRAPIPPPGPNLPFPRWAQTVHRTILDYIPGVTASGNAKGVTITHRPGLEGKGPPSLSEIAAAAAPTLTARITPKRSAWYVTFDRNGAFTMPPLAIDRHDSFTAHVVAETIVGFFDATQSTPAKRKASAVKDRATPK